MCVAQEDVLAASRAHRFIPPHRADATCAADAYPIADLIPPAVWGALEVHTVVKAAGNAEFRQAAIEQRVVRVCLCRSATCAVQRQWMESHGHRLCHLMFCSCAGRSCLRMW